MDLGDLGTPAHLWRRWVLLAAGQAACGTSAAEIRRADGSARLESGGGWVRMRRMAGNRAVLWGSHPCLAAGPDFHEELLDAAPDWSYDIDSRYRNQDVGFLGWYAHGQWSSVPRAAESPAVAELLAPVRDDDAVRSWWLRSWPAAGEDAVEAALREPGRETFAAVHGSAASPRGTRQLDLGEGWATRQLSTAATTHLRTQIHAQMHGCAELADRGLPRRPTLLRQWARVNLTGVGFRHTVCALPSTGGGRALVHGVGGIGLDEPQQRSLDNVLLELRMAETDEKSGAWLFARVASDGRQLTLERRFDGWPSWYAAPDGRGGGPTMSALYAEMEQRAPLWRPDWATLIPADRYGRRHGEA